MIRTWLPDESFVESASLLHDAEIHRVRGDVLFILNVLAGRHQHMKYNPSVTMWRGSELLLVSYGVIMCREWKARGQNEKLEAQIYAFAEEAIRTGDLTPPNNGNKPWWLGVAGFHMSHRSGLIALRPEFYGKLWRDVPDNLPMVMPVGTAPGGGKSA